MWSLCKDISHSLHLGALQVGPLFSQLPPLLQKLKVRRSARLTADAASYPYSENYHWWYGMDFVKRLLVIKFATFQHNTNVSIFTVTLIMYIVYSDWPTSVPLINSNFKTLPLILIYDWCLA